jgi:VWFA-related protein
MEKLTWVAMVLVGLLGTASGSAQENPPAAAERVGGLAFVDEVQVTVVNVDVFVRDGKGKPVAGLGVDDFRILQNGIEMPISNFAELNAEAIGHRMQAAAVDAPTAAAEAASVTSDVEIRPIWVVLYIDNENIKTLDRNRVLRRVRSFVTENLAEPVRMMVVSYQRRVKVLQPFTTSPSDVTGVLRDLAMVTGGREEVESERRKLLEAMNDARNQDYGTDRNSQQTAKLHIRQQVASFASEEAYNLRLSLDGIRQTIAMLSGIEGRKSIVYVSSGLPMEPGIGLMHDYAMSFRDQSILSLRSRYDGTRQFHELTSQANAQEVSLYSIDATGLTPLDGFDAESSYSRDPTAASLGASNYQASLTYMADATGGLAVVNTNDVTGGLERIADDLFNYYSMGYTVNTSGEDRVHRIKVELTDGQGYDLRFRRRFVERSHESQIQDRVMTSLVVDIDDNPMAVELAALQVQPGSSETWIAPLHLSLDLSTIALMPEGDDELVGRIVVFIGAGDDGGGSSEIQRQEHEIRLPTDEYLAAGRERFGFDFRLLLGEGRHRVAVGVMDAITREDSYKRITVTVP